MNKPGPAIYLSSRPWLNTFFRHSILAMNILHFLLALVVILALAWLVSFDRKTVRLRYLLQPMVIEAALAYFFLHCRRLQATGLTNPQA